VQQASAALGEHLAAINHRRAAWPARALAILKDRGQPRGPFLRAVCGGEARPSPDWIFQTTFGWSGSWDNASPLAGRTPSRVGPRHCGQSTE
jgi:hypothetical protein